MSTRLIALLALAMLAFAASSHAAGKRGEKAAVSFHMETDAGDNPKMTFPQVQANGQTRYFRRMAEIGTKDVVSFSPFPADDGSYGIVFRLKEPAARRFAAITNANQGRWLLAMMNGRIVDGVLIDKQVDDGMAVVWKNATLADIALFDESLPRIGKENAGKQKN
jgi:hypothetical protein